MNREALVKLIREKQSFLCVGLDTDPSKLPESLKDDAAAVVTFNRKIIEATLPYTVAYKFNIAFYEALGAAGWQMLEDSIACIPSGSALIIADAKRGDIGNTAEQYGKAFFEAMNCDAITINPYMGEDSIAPFLHYKGKWGIVLGLTSNKGANDFEMLRLDDGRFLYEEVIKKTASFGTEENLMFVVGATQSAHFERIRNVAPKHFLLVPGVGAQGGTLEDLRPLLHEDIGLLVNSSRQIIYASKGSDFSEAAAKEASNLQMQMAAMIEP